jgi:hypothetical protein
MLIIEFLAKFLLQIKEICLQGGGWALVLMKVIVLKCEQMMIDIRQPGWVGCALAFLALCKVGFVSGFCVPCNVLKIA